MKFEHYKCKYCKTEVRADEKKCWNCGTKKDQDKPKSLPMLDKFRKKK